MKISIYSHQHDADDIEQSTTHLDPYLVLTAEARDAFAERDLFRAAVDIAGKLVGLPHWDDANADWHTAPAGTKDWTRLADGEKPWTHVTTDSRLKVLGYTGEAFIDIS